MFGLFKEFYQLNEMLKIILSLLFSIFDVTNKDEERVML